MRTLSVCSLALGCALMTAAQSDAAIVGLWNFNEGSGTTAADSSSNGRNGTLGAAGTGDLPTWIANGRFGNALEFNTPSTTAGGGTNGSLVTVPFSEALRLNGAFSISFWWRPDSDFTSGFPGAMRIGAQSTTTGTNIGWGFFHNSTEAPVFKRGNVQPSIASPAVPMSIGDWHQITISYDGAGNNIAVQDGVARTFTQSWLEATTSANFEIGRMDNYVNAGLDDIGLFDHAFTLGEARSIYTVPDDLGLSYSLAEMQALWQIHTGGVGTSGVVGGQTWNFSNSLPGTFAAGDAFTSGGASYVALTATTGVTAVPEPASAVLAAASGLLLLRRKRSALSTR